MQEFSSYAKQKRSEKRPAFCKSVGDQLRSKEANLASRIGLENEAGKETKMDGCVPQSITQWISPEPRTLVVRKRIHPEFTEAFASSSARRHQNHEKRTHELNQKEKERASNRRSHRHNQRTQQPKLTQRGTERRNRNSTSQIK